jgi:hypothetical protein
MGDATPTMTAIEAIGTAVVRALPTASAGRSRGELAGEHHGQAGHWRVSPAGPGPKKDGPRQLATRYMATRLIDARIVVVNYRGTMRDDASLRAVNDALRRNADAVRQLLLSCRLLNVRLGDEISDTMIIKAPERIVPYRLQDIGWN